MRTKSLPSEVHGIWAAAGYRTPVGDRAQLFYDIKAVPVDIATRRAQRPTQGDVPISGSSNGDRRIGRRCRRIPGISKPATASQRDIGRGSHNTVPQNINITHRDQSRTARRGGLHSDPLRSIDLKRCRVNSAACNCSYAGGLNRPVHCLRCSAAKSHLELLRITDPHACRDWHY